MLTGIALRLFTVLPKHLSTSSAMALVDVGGMRRDYPGERAAFDVSDLASRDPTRQFEAWFDSAKQDPKVEEANAMCLSTASAGGAPSSRMVLMKEFGPAGFVFFTNYGSRKGRELEENPRAALLFYWESSKRQVRIEGKVEKVSTEQSVNYFDSRPIGSRIGAAVSEQSKVIRDRGVLNKKEEELKREFLTPEGEEDPSKRIVKPDNWGGFRVVPDSFEFWQGRSSRIHDRLRFRRREEAEREAKEEQGGGESLFVEGENGWVIERLAP